MTIAAKLKAEGRAEGRAEGEACGEARGEARGRLKLLQEMMGLPVAGNEELKDLDVAGVEQRFQVLQREYQAQFKGK